MANDVSERRRAEHRNAALSKLGQSLSSATSAQDAAGIIKDVADDLFRWDVFTLNLCSQDQEQLLPVLNVDTDRKGERFAISSLGRAIPLTPFAKRVIANGAEMILREEPFTFTDGATPIGDVNRPSGSLIFVPIRHGKRVIGILSIQSYSARAYDHRDLDMLQTLADHCGGALERIRAEQALHQSELMFHSVWENAVEGMRLTDAQGRVIAVNEAYCRIIRITREQLEGKPFTAVYPPTDQAETWLEEYRKKFVAREAIEGAQWTCKLHNGSAVTLEETGCFIELRGQAPLLLTVFRDVSEQKRLEEQLRHSQKMEAIGQLAGGVAHDFNNILTVIHGHASLLERSPVLPETCLRSARQVSQAAERAAALTRQLLTFGRRQVMQPRTLDMNEVVGNFTRMLGRILGEDIAVQLKYSPELALVRADACMMEQVLMNLAVNSRDAMPKGGLLTIKVSVREHGDNPGSFKVSPRREQVWLEVSDTGCGIPATNLSRIFEPFFTTKEVGKGTGLGLATVYGIVQQHQGRVEVSSEVGVGTTFRILLPRCEDDQPRQKEGEPEDPVKGGHETILVVEDEREVRELVCSLLAQFGYTILQAESGAKALELWRQKRDKIHLLLTDLIMPDRVNGRELAERLLAEDPGLRVLFTSGYSADVVGRDFAISREFKFLQKPYQPQKLAAAVRQCLDPVN
jgi:PAS domain S-box-containing protein